MSKLLVPIRYAQMSKPVVFWYNRKLDFIMLPASPIAPPPAGYQRIECRHAHEVDKWSDRLRAQEKRIREMTDYERYLFEEPIREQMMRELKRNLAKATDAANRMFLATCIEMIEKRRRIQQQQAFESFMHCEAKDGVAQ